MGRDGLSKSWKKIDGERKLTMVTCMRHNIHTPLAVACFPKVLDRRRSSFRVHPVAIAIFRPIVSDFGNQNIDMDTYKQRSQESSTHVCDPRLVFGHEHQVRVNVLFVRVKSIIRSVSV